MAIIRPPGFEMPSENEWNLAALSGERIVKKGLSELILKYSKSNESALFPALILGAVVAAGELFHIVRNPDFPHLGERYAVAYLRGAIRGLNGPVHEDGRPFVQADDG